MVSEQDLADAEARLEARDEQAESANHHKKHYSAAVWTK
jgi:hypothetical protein